MGIWTEIANKVSDARISSPHCLMNEFLFCGDLLARRIDVGIAACDQPFVSPRQTLKAAKQRPL